MPKFDKSADLFPIKQRFTFLNHCGVASVYAPAADAQAQIAHLLAQVGSTQIGIYTKTLAAFRQAGARLLRTADKNISFVQNSAQGLNQIAYGYPFNRGDEILSYRFEYPSNHYPWKIQEERGAVLRLIDGRFFEGRPLSFDAGDVERALTPKTKVVALSHVQFASGFKIDLNAIGALCRSRGICFVLDAAQSAGCIPLYPDEMSVDALVVSGWKWLLGPIGSGVMFTSESFRAKLRDTFVGPEMMTQGADYLNHTFSPHVDGRRFEYSTLPISIVAGLEAAVSRLTEYGIDAVWQEVERLQAAALPALISPKLRPAPLSPEQRGGILSFIVGSGNPGDTAEAAQAVASKLVGEGVVCTARGGYLRIAPHYYQEDAEVFQAAEKINRAVERLT